MGDTLHFAIGIFTKVKKRTYYLLNIHKNLKILTKAFYYLIAFDKSAQCVHKVGMPHTTTTYQYVSKYFWHININSRVRYWIHCVRSAMWCVEHLHMNSIRNTNLLSFRWQKKAMYLLFFLRKHWKVWSHVQKVELGLRAAKLIAIWSM